jgi:chromosomal replication initiation ATPase DnaA
LREEDFLDAPSNAEARAWLDRTAEWPVLRLALFGEGGVGKTHLLHIWATRHAAQVLDGLSLGRQTLGFAPPAGAVAIDNADEAPAAPLLHILNALAEGGHPVLLAAREPPARWPVTLPDLASRLRAILAVAIDPPEEALLRSILMRMLAERQLAVPEAVQEWMLMRLARTPDALREAAARFDSESLTAGKSTPRAIAARVVQQMQGFRDSADVLPSNDEDFASPTFVASPEGRSLL